MQYFGTAQAAVCTAIHSLLLQGRGRALHLFPALPSGWREVEFQRLLAAGLTISARLTAGMGGPRVDATVRNSSPAALTREIWFNQQVVPITLQPDEERILQWPYSIGDGNANPAL